MAGFAGPNETDRDFRIDYTNVQSISARRGENYASSLFFMGSHVIPCPPSGRIPLSSCFFVRLTASRFFVPA